MAFDADWKVAGYATLPIRFVQGWIFWGGGSRRFIYDPQKLDPHATDWMANKFQSAMPGAMFGMEHVIGFMLQHFYLLYTSIILFSLAELIAGVALIAGFCTRLAAFTTVLISLVLMLAFGWQGATCMDEWTMAVSTLVMGLTLTLSGASVYSVDHYIWQRSARLRRHKWFVAIASGPLTMAKLKRVSAIFFIFTVLFTLFTYNYYRGAIWSSYHAGPVNPREHHLTLSDGRLQSDGSVVFSVDVDAGTPAEPGHIIRIELVNQAGKVMAEWNGNALSKLSVDNIKNTFQYNIIQTGPYGLVAPESAKAAISLPPSLSRGKLPKGDYVLRLFTISGNQFQLPVHY